MASFYPNLHGLRQRIYREALLLYLALLTTFSLQQLPYFKVNRVQNLNYEMRSNPSSYRYMKLLLMGSLFNFTFTKRAEIVEKSSVT